MNDLAEWNQAPHRRAVGQVGEDQAWRHLEAQGYTLLARNWRYRRHEIDLIVADRDGTLVFVEVKANRSGASGAAAARVDGRKILRIQRVAEQYCVANHARNRPMRFDVIALEPTSTGMELLHYRDAFLPQASGYFG